MGKYTPLKILALYDNSGPKYHRILMPVASMPGIDFTIAHRVTEENIQDIDILFFNRGPNYSSIQSILDLREKYGFSIIVDFDDHWVIGPEHYGHKFVNKVKENHSKYISVTRFERAENLLSAFNEDLQVQSLAQESWIKEADAVTVTHERLFNDVFPLNKNVHIFPNAIPEWGQFACKKIPSDFTRVFWSGSPTHKRDIELLKNPIKRIQSPAVQFVMAGYHAKNPEWAAMASAFTNGGRSVNELIEALPVDQYYYSYSKCDIALVPLLETKFNSYKSNLKVLEAANVGAPVVVSMVNPYLDFPDHLVNYVRSQGDWYKHITRLLNCPGEAKYQGERLKEYCKKTFNFNEINERRKSLFYETRKQAIVGEVPTLSYQSGG